jgi:hypothetical protein
MGGNVLGLGTPATPLLSLQNPWSLSPYGVQGIGISPFGSTQTYGQQPVQQILQFLQAVPQQLQHLQQLQYQQLQLLQQLQQLVQIVPAQLQQLIQFAPQQTQQPFNQLAAGFPVAPWGISPQIFGAQSSHVM